MVKSSFYIFFQPLTFEEKVISSKQHYMSFISDTFISNTAWDLIQNNNSLRYHKELKKNQYNCTEPPAFKIQRYEVIRNYCITISVHKISSIQKLNLKIQQNLESYELKGHAYPKIQTKFNFFELVSTCKKSGNFIDLFCRFRSFKNTAIWLEESILAHIFGLRFLPKLSTETQ